MRVLREDMVNPDLLYLGTEFAMFASIQRGAAWFKINGSTLPTVAVHEIAQPTTAGEIVAATHGRSLWVIDVTTLRQLKPQPGKNQLFAPAAVIRWQLDFTHEGMFKTGTRQFVGQNPPRQAVIDFLLSQKAAKPTLKILDSFGSLVREFDLAKEKEPGIHRIRWDLVGGGTSGAAKEKKTKQAKQGKQGAAAGGQPVKPGVYLVVLNVDGDVQRRLLTVEPDPRTKTAGIAVDEAEELRRWLGQQP
jgi:hypothetical protein